MIYIPVIVQGALIALIASLLFCVVALVIYQGED